MAESGETASFDVVDGRSLRALHAPLRRERGGELVARLAPGIYADAGSIDLRAPNGSGSRLRLAGAGAGPVIVTRLPFHLEARAIALEDLAFVDTGVAVPALVAVVSKAFTMRRVRVARCGTAESTAYGAAFQVAAAKDADAPQLTIEASWFAGCVEASPGALLGVDAWPGVRWDHVRVAGSVFAGNHFAREVHVSYASALKLTDCLVVRLPPVSGPAGVFLSPPAGGRASIVRSTLVVAGLQDIASGPTDITGCDVLLLDPDASITPPPHLRLVETGVRRAAPGALSDVVARLVERLGRGEPVDRAHACAEVLSVAAPR